MSAVLMDVRPSKSSSFGEAVTSPVDGSTVRAHPRGKGFGVLSRIARVQASEPDYAPRHRREVPIDLGLCVPLAV